MSGHVDVNPVIDAMAGRKVPAAVNGVGALLLLIGLGAAGYGFAVAGAAPTWGAILTGLFWTLGICQGAFMLSIILTGTWGRWGRPIKRISESFIFLMPVLYVVLFVFLIAGGLGIYKWHPNPIGGIEHISLKPHSLEAYPSKEIYLDSTFFTLRLLIGLLVLMVLDFVYLRASLGPDMLMAKQRLGDVPGWWSFFIGGKTDVEKASEAGQTTQSNLFWIIGLAYAVVWTVLAVDLLMTLEPWWYANMFPGWVAVSSVWTGLCATGLVAMLARDWLKLGDFVKPHVTHDLGKLMLAACMFWAYTLYAQLLPIWYANMPEETQFLLLRLGSEEDALLAWRWMSQAVGVLCFVAPFTILLSRGIKKMRWPFAAICSLILFGMFMERSLIVMPQVYPDVTDVFPLANFLIVQVGVWVGFIGFLIVGVANVLANIPPLVVSDPHLPEHPWDQHVHSLDAHHAH